MKKCIVHAAMGLLAACAQVPTITAPADRSVPPGPGVVAPERILFPPSPPVTQATQQQAQNIALAAAGLLESGHEDQGKAELQRALVADPNNKLALNLMRQIVDDPATLGRESFSYTVLPNDTMSTIAGRFLGDIYNFYILARYNKIAVPRQVAGGQVLRIPGKAPPSSVREAPAPPPSSPAVRPNPAPPVVVARVTPPPPEPTPGERAMRAGETAERGGSVERALDEYRRAADLQQPGAQAKVEQLRKQLVQRYSLSARTALARQDLEEAIRGWDRVLNIDPGNDIAKVERQRAMVLKQKLQGLGEAAPRAGRETASAP